MPAATPPATDTADACPWTALALDRSLPLAPAARADLIANLRSGSRQYLLPLLRPLARTAIVGIQLLKLLLPRRFASSRLLHASIAWGLARFVRPDANRLILRHFHLGSEILRFVADNAGVEVETTPLRPANLRAIREGLFVQHDVNLFAFVTRLNRALDAAGSTLEARALPELDFGAISENEPPLEPMPEGPLQRLDVASAIELYTPLYQLLLSDDDFWRASNSLQLDETIGIYVCRILGDWSRLALVNNRHPLIPESTLRAGHRLLLHGLATESLHGMLVEAKRAQRAQTTSSAAAAGSPVAAAMARA